MSNLRLTGTLTEIASKLEDINLENFEEIITKPDHDNDGKFVAIAYKKLERVMMPE